MEVQAKERVLHWLIPGDMHLRVSCHQKLVVQGAFTDREIVAVMAREERRNTLSISPKNLSKTLEVMSLYCCPASLLARKFAGMKPVV